MTSFLRTPDSNFEDIKDYPFEPNYFGWEDIRVHYIDEGPKDGPVVLLVHGMPTWSYLYRDFIKILVDAGYRCIAPDHLGFGKSDKPTEDSWYTIARHTEVLASLISSLDLRNITLVCQDWGGPIGLAQAVMMSHRFERLVIMNTWLHHSEYEYSAAIKRWNASWHEGGLFDIEAPDVGILVALTDGLISRDSAISAIRTGSAPTFRNSQGAETHRAYIAPFLGLPDAAYTSLRKFPLSIPFDNYNRGSGFAQSFHFSQLKNWTQPIHFIWGGADDIFTEKWGKQWSEQFPQSTFHVIEQASHFLQNTHGIEIAHKILERIQSE